MEKRMYIYPQVEVLRCETQKLMQVAPPSDQPTPPGVSERKEPTF